LLFFGDVSTGPGSDLRYATAVAAEIVGACGMNGTLISYPAVADAGLGTNLAGRVLADPAGRAQVERFLQKQRRAVRRLLDRHRHLVAAPRDALLERHELVGAQITDVLKAAGRPSVIDLGEGSPAPRHAG
jgi:ATP-dependent Zn protease